MIIKINENRQTEPNFLKVANKFENRTRLLQFDFSQVMTRGNKYLLCKHQMEMDCYSPLPIINDQLDLQVFLTQKSGFYSCVVAITNTVLDDDYKFSDDNIMFISNQFQLYVEENGLTNTSQAWELAPQIKIKFDELVALVDRVRNDLANGVFKGEKGDPYTSSPEFVQLSQQVRNDAQSSELSSQNAKASENNAKTSELNTKKSEDNAKLSETKSSTSEISALDSMTKAKTSELNAKASEDKAKASEAISKTNADNSSASAVQAENAKNVVIQNAAKIEQNVSQIEQNKNDIDTLEIMFKMQRTGKIYGVKKWKSAVNPTSTCDKIYDNKGLVCEMSTDTIEGRDDYAEIPLFKWQRVNYKRYDDGFAYPIAFEGDETFNNVDNADVGNIYMTFYYNEIDKGDYTELVISDTPNQALGLKPWEEAVRADGTVMPYFIMSAYEAVRGSDGLLHSLPNKKSAGFMSYNSIIDEFQKKGKGYWGAGANRFTFAQIFSQIKYGTKDIQSLATGNTGYCGHYTASIKRAEKLPIFPVTRVQADHFVVGSRVSVGYQGVVNGRPTGDTTYNEPHSYGREVEILKIEHLADGANSLIHLDCEPFSTEDVVNQGITVKACITAMPWLNGTTDNVIGHHDGCWQNFKNNKMPIRIQGIEYLCGRWFVASDTIVYLNADMSRDVYLAPRGVAHVKDIATIKKTYTKIGTIPPSKKGNGADYWVGDITIKNGGWYPSAELEAQNSYKDYLYFGGTAVNTEREYLLGGTSGNYSDAGLGCLNLGAGVGNSYWHYACAD